MSKPKPFVIPEGVVFQIQDDGVIIENAGDVVLHTNFGRPLKRIVSREGSVEIHAPVSGGEVLAARDVSLHGGAQADRVAAGGSVSIHGAAAVRRIEAAGSVAIHGDAKGQAIEAGGGITVTGSATVDRISGGGEIEVQGNLQGGTVLGGTIRLTGTTITAKGVQATLAVHVGASKLAVDAIIAPDVFVDPKTSGRVTVVESQNELGQNAIKGGFRLADYAEMFGDPDAFLRERGLSPLGEAPPVAAPDAAAPPPVEVAAEPPAPPPVEAAAEPVAEPVAVAPADDDPASNVVTLPAPPEPAVEADAEEDDAEPMGAEDADEGQDGPAAVHVGTGTPVMLRVASAAVAVAPALEEDEEPEPVEPEPVEAEPVDEDEGSIEATAPSSPSGAPVPEIPEHPLHKQLVEAVTRIVECYGEAELPPAVARLRELIDTRTYDKVRGEITAIWSDLLKYHQKKGMRIQHQVTTTFNTINSLVKKM